MASDGLIHALVLDGKGGARALDWAGVEAWQPADGVLWLNFDYAGASVADWLANKSKLDPVVVSALVFWLADAVHPLLGLAVNVIVFFILRGADGDNLNIRAAALHVMGDLLGSVAAVVASIERCISCSNGLTLTEPSGLALFECDEE